jgi:hypothetical protein
VSVVAAKPTIRPVAVLTAFLLAGIVFEVVKHRTGYWQLAAFGLGPDAALLLGVGTGLVKGQLHPRAVPLYNLVHRFWGPIALLAAASVLPLSLGWLIGGLAWAFHVSLDRTLGYGLRTPDGFQRS